MSSVENYGIFNDSLKYVLDDSSRSEETKYIFISLVLAPCESSYAGYSFKRMCMKIVYLDTELLKDAMRKVESVQHIRTFYRKSHEYQLGGIVYDLRKKFQRMTRLYKKSFDHMNDEDHNQVQLLKYIIF